MHTQLFTWVLEIDLRSFITQAVFPAPAHFKVGILFYSLTLLLHILILHGPPNASLWLSSCSAEGWHAGAESWAFHLPHMATLHSVLSPE